MVIEFQFQSCYAQWVVNNNADFINGTMQSRTTRLGSAFFFDNSLYPIDIVVPYYSRNPCYLTYNDKSLAVPPPPFAVMGLSTQQTAKNYIVYVAAADDFMLGCRTSIPRIRYGPHVSFSAAKSNELNFSTAPQTDVDLTIDKVIALVPVNGKDYLYRYDGTAWVSVQAKKEHITFKYVTVDKVAGWAWADGVYPPTKDIPKNIS